MYSRVEGLDALDRIRVLVLLHDVNAKLLLTCRYMPCQTLGSRLYKSSVHVVSTEKLFSPACRNPLMRVHLRVGTGQSRLVRVCGVCGGVGWVDGLVGVRAGGLTLVHFSAA